MNAVVAFLKDERGFELTQFATYAALAIGALSFIWFVFLKNRIHTAGERIGGTIEKGYNDIQ